MKRITLAILFACFTLALMAQESIRVNSQGATPTISDFVWAYLFSDIDDEDECDQEATAGIKRAWIRHRSGVRQPEGVTLTVDEKNGYVLYETRYEEYTVRTEMCYWNESDGKHKLFAYSSWLFKNGKPNLGQYDDIVFYRYDNATKKMDMCPRPGFDVEYHNTCYTLPRKGKDIIVISWDDNGKKKQRTLKWNGSSFDR